MSDEGTEPVETESPAPRWIVRIVQLFYLAVAAAAIVLFALAAGFLSHAVARLFMLGWRG